MKDFGPSWRTGLAFFAVIHALRPDLVDMERVCGRPNKENLQEAFLLAETELGIPQLLDPDGEFSLSHTRILAHSRVEGSAVKTGDLPRPLVSGAVKALHVNH